MIDIQKIREDFPILNEKVLGKPLVYLDNAATTQKCKSVLEKIADFYTTKYSNIHRGVHSLSEAASKAYEDARKTVGKFIHAEKSEEVIFTQGTTDSVNLVATAYGQQYVNAGDEIIVTEMEHHSNIIPWQMLCERKGAKLKVLPMNDAGMLALEKLPALLNNKTKLVAVSHVSNVLGTINPLKDIIEQAHNKGIPVLVDAAQSVKHLPVDMQELDCDFFAFSGHKMYAETGIGVLYGKHKWLDAMPPYKYGGSMVTNVNFDKSFFQPPPLRFEAGTVNFVGAVSMAAAISYLEETGYDAISDHEQALYQYAKKKLHAHPKITIYGNPDKACGALSFNIDGVHHYDAGVMLDKLGIAVRTGLHCAQPVMVHYGIPGSIRASFALYNSKDEVDQLTEGIERIQKMMY